MFFSENNTVASMNFVRFHQNISFSIRNVLPSPYPPLSRAIFLYSNRYASSWTISDSRLNSPSNGNSVKFLWTAGSRKRLKVSWIAEPSLKVKNRNETVMERQLHSKAWDTVPGFCHRQASESKGYGRVISRTNEEAIEGIWKWPRSKVQNIIGHATSGNQTFFNEYMGNTRMRSEFLAGSACV